MTLSKSLARKFNLYTISAVCFLILVGGIVRSMGAGMGCPDWPKCFGSYTPPSNASDLPGNYKDIYVQSRLKKNQHLARTLKGLGFFRLAEKVSNDPGVQEATSFDPIKAKVEYVNRLVGVLIGFLIIFNMIFSFAYQKDSRSVPILGVGGFVLVVFQGWIGSLVVSTNLLPGFITFHMILALLLVAILLIQRFKMETKHQNIWGRHWITVLLVLFTLQVIFGTQIREHVDSIRAAGIVKDHWIENLGVLFYIHRSYSLILAGLAGFVFYKNYKMGNTSLLLNSLTGIIFLEILLGIIMAYFAMPAFASPAHLFLGTLAFGVIFYLFLSTNFKRSIA